MSNLFEGTEERKLRKLRPRQDAGMDMLRQRLRAGSKRVVFAAPPSFGKTLCAAHMIAGALDRGKRVCFVVPAIVLIEQTVKAFEKEGIRDIGIIQGRHARTRPYARVQVASVQTLTRRKLPKVDLVIWDEMHIAYKAMLEILADEWKDVTAIGLSGTPGTRGLANHWADIVVPATTAELMEEGWMAPYIVYAPADEYEVDLSNVKSVAGEYDERQTSAVMSEKRIVANVVETWLAKAVGLPTFLYGVDCAHAQLLRDQFLAVGVPTGYIDGETPQEEREEIFAKLRCGEVQIICSVGTLILGVDEPVWCIIDAAPTRSKMRQAQKIPRMLRLDPDGKPKQAILLDHASNTLRLGLVEDMRWDYLDDGSKQSKEERDKQDAEAPKPKKCKRCNAVVPPRERKCGVCGFEPPRINTVEHVPGELVLMGSGHKGKSGKDKFTQQEKQQFYAELLGYAEMHGKKPGWAWHKTADKFGVHATGKPAPVAPSMETVNWIKSQTIKWIKGKEKAARIEAKASASAPWGGLAQ
jgi:DNA repair protein RadD